MASRKIEDVASEDQAGAGQNETLVDPFRILAPTGTDVQRLRERYELITSNVVLPNFQLFAVEQWVVDRSRVVTKIVAYTGNPSHKITVDLFTPKGDSFAERQEIWDYTLQRGREDGAQPRQTPFGVIFVVSMVGFRSDYSTALIPDGDFDKHKEALYTNINLRRLGHGRSGLSLSEPILPIRENFLSAYRLPSTYSAPDVFGSAVVALIKLVQSALALFNMGPLKTGPFAILQPDGLLCDSTLNELTKWQFDVAEPFLSTEFDGNVLSPRVLAALLSMVIVAKNRLAALGVHHLPSDPFTQRQTFLAAYESYLRSFRTNEETHYLTKAGLEFIRSQHARNNKESLTRAIRHRLDDLRVDIVTGGSRPGSLDEETTDIATFANAIVAHSSSEYRSLVKFWKGSHRRETIQRAFEDPYKQTPRASTVPAHTVPQITVSDRSEDEAGKARTFLKGVSKRTKKLGDGVTGLLDKATPKANYQSREEGVPASRRLTAQADFPTEEEIRLRIAASMAAEEAARNRGSSPHPIAASTAMSAATSNDSHGRTGDADAEGAGPKKDASSTLQAPGMRRAASDSGTQATAATGSPTGSGSDQASEPATAKRRRRHSFFCLRELSHMTRVMSPRRMKLEVDLYYEFYRLRAKERELKRIHTVLQEVESAYDQALKQITDRIRTRSGNLTHLQDDTKQLNREVDLFVGTAQDVSLYGSLSASASIRRQGTLSASNPASGAKPTGKLHIENAVANLKNGTDELGYSSRQLSERITGVVDSSNQLSTKIAGSEVVLGSGSGSSKSAPPESIGSIITSLQRITMEGSAAQRALRKLRDTWRAYL